MLQMSTRNGRIDPDSEQGRVLMSMESADNSPTEATYPHRREPAYPPRSRRGLPPVMPPLPSKLARRRRLSTGSAGGRIDESGITNLKLAMNQQVGFFPHIKHVEIYFTIHRC